MSRAVHVKLFVCVWVLGLVLFASAAARAETWQAPVGGKALPLPEGREHLHRQHRREPLKRASSPVLAGTISRCPRLPLTEVNARLTPSAP